MIKVNLFLTDEELNKSSYDTKNRQYWKVSLLISKIDSDNIINQFLLNGVYYKPDDNKDLNDLKIYVYISSDEDTKKVTEKKLEEVLNLKHENIRFEKETIPLSKIKDENKIYYVPRLIKAPFAKKYKNNVIMKLDPNKDMTSFNKTLDFVFICTEGRISCARYDKNDKQFYFLKLENITKNFLFHSLCANNNLKVFYEYSYPYINPNLGKIFVEKGYKPVFLEPFLIENHLSVMEAIEKNVSTTSVKVDFNSFVFSSDDFYPIGKMISLESKCEKVDVNLDTDMKSFNIDMTLERSHTYHYQLKTLSQLHLKKRELEKERRLIQNQIDSIQSATDKKQYVLYKISRKELNQFFRFIHTIDDQLLKDADNFKIYQLSSYKNDEEQIYCVTSPLSLIPAFIHDVYIEDKNYSENFKVYVPRGKNLFPMIKMDNDLFINALAKKIQISKEEIKMNYFALCDDKNIFGKENDEKEWIIKLVKHNERGRKVIDYKNDLEVDYLIQHECGAINIEKLLDPAKNSWGFEDAINKFDESITKSISDHINTTIEKWEGTLKLIIKKDKDVNKKFESIAGVLSKFEIEWTKKIGVDELFVKIENGINEIINLSKELGEKLTTDDLKSEHQKLVDLFKECKKELETIKKELPVEKDKFKSESNSLRQEIIKNSGQIKDLLDTLNKLEQDICRII